MALLTMIVAAEEDELEAIGESLRPTEEWSGIERRGLDIPKLATLHCLLTDDDFDPAFSQCEPIYIAGEGGLVIAVAESVMQKLAEFDEEALTQVAEELAATEAFEADPEAPWDADSVYDFVMELAELAQLADSQGQVLYVWMHPLLT